ncbi:hypothetical protein TSUD_234980 [Trifolium subterraneum]|uniref:Uncharacterized protein n=1 Tax=Trifolium subterraneum TaxID=3900 RepID=A0A2Z6LUY5_TRISU|nr:hypothetical protein TSUD_234980 [Trifolium subterraneum]
MECGDIVFNLSYNGNQPCFHFQAQERMIIYSDKGKIAIEKLIDSEVEQENRDFPDQFQFVKNLIERLDHEVWS